MDLIRREDVDHFLAKEAYYQYMGRAMRRVEYFQIIRKKIADEVQPITLNTLRDEIYNDAVAHGLWEETDDFGAEDPEEPDEAKRRADAEFCKQYDAVQKLLFESDEALCAVEDRDWEHVQEEIADVVIQAFSTAGYLGIDIDAAIRRKMAINKERPWKHGKTE